MATKKNTQIGEYEYYRFTKTIGHKPDGKPIKKQFLGTSKRDAELMKIICTTGLYFLPFTLVCEWVSYSVLNGKTYMMI